MYDFFSMIWSGMQTVIIPPFGISAASMALGIFVVDLSIGILSTLIRFYGGVSHSVTRVGRVPVRMIRRR